MLITNRAHASNSCIKLYGAGASNAYGSQLYETIPATANLGGAYPYNVPVPDGYTDNFIWFPVSDPSGGSTVLEFDYAITLTESFIKQTSKFLAFTLTTTLAKSGNVALIKLFSVTISAIVEKLAAFQRELDYAAVLSSIYEKDVGLNRLFTAGATLTKNLSANLTKTLQINLTSSVDKLTSFFRNFPYLVILSPSQFKAVGKILQFSLSLSNSLRKNIGKALSYAIAASATIQKAANKSLLFSITCAQSLIKSLSSSFDFLISSVSSLRKGTGKHLAFSLSLSAAVSSSLAKVYGYLVSTSVTINSLRAKIFGYTVTTTGSLQKSVGKGLTYLSNLVTRSVYNIPSFKEFGHMLILKALNRLINSSKTIRQLKLKEVDRQADSLRDRREIEVENDRTD